AYSMPLRASKSPVCASASGASAKSSQAMYLMQTSLFPQDQEFQQRLLRVQAVLGFVPHHALRTVDDLGGDFLAAVRRQAVHEERFLRRRFHHLGVDLPVVEVALAILVVRLEAHR